MSFKSSDCGFVASLAAEQLHNFHRSTNACERLKEEYSRALKFKDAVISVLIQQILEHLPSKAFVFGEIIALLDIVRPLMASERLLVKGYVTNDIEDVCIGKFGIGFPDSVYEDIVFLQFVNDSLLSVSRTPFVDEVIERGILAANILPRKGGKTFCYEGMAIGSQIGYFFSIYLNVLPIHMVFGMPVRNIRFVKFSSRLGFCVITINNFRGRSRFGVAIEIGVLE